jgi:hypothetical protein
MAHNVDILDDLAVDILDDQTIREILLNGFLDEKTTIMTGKKDL